AYAPRPGQPASRYSLDEAQVWLSYIAKQMTERHTRDLAWWQMPTWRSRVFRSVASALLTVLAMWFISWPMLCLTFGFLGLGMSAYEPRLALSFGVGLATGVVAGRAREPRVWGSIRWKVFTSRLISKFVKRAIFLS